MEAQMDGMKRYRQTDRHTDRQIDKQTDRQTEYQRGDKSIWNDKLVLIWNFEWLRMCYVIIFLNRSRLIFVEYYNKHIWASPGTFI